LALNKSNIDKCQTDQRPVMLSRTDFSNTSSRNDLRSQDEDKNERT